MYQRESEGFYGLFLLDSQLFFGYFEIGLSLKTIVQITTFGQKTKLLQFSIAFHLLKAKNEFGKSIDQMKSSIFEHFSHENLQKLITYPNHNEIYRMYLQTNRMEDKLYQQKYFQMILSKSKQKSFVELKSAVLPSQSEATKNRRRISSSVNFDFCQKYLI